MNGFGCKIYLEAPIQMQQLINIAAFLQRLPDMHAKMQLTE